MPSEITDFGTAAFLAVLFGVASPLSGFYIALCSDEPGVDSDGTILADLEPAGGGYARQPYGVGAGNWDLNANYLTNSLDVDFGTPTVDWGPLNHYALLDAATGGDLYAYGEFLNPSYVPAGFDLFIPAGGIVLAMSSVQSSIAV